jgi:CRP-like cAMP-binding protein
VLELRRYETGDLIVRREDPAAFLFFLVYGQASVLVDPPAEGSDVSPPARRACSSARWRSSKGGRARPMSAPDAAVECYAMSRERFERLTATHPDIKMKLLENFARRLSVRVRKLTDEVRALGA